MTEDGYQLMNRLLQRRHVHVVVDDSFSSQRKTYKSQSECLASPIFNLASTTYPEIPHGAVSKE